MHAAMHGAVDGLLGARRLNEALVDSGVLVNPGVIHAENLERLCLDLTRVIPVRRVLIDERGT